MTKPTKTEIRAGIADAQRNGYPSKEVKPETLITSSAQDGAAKRRAAWFTEIILDAITEAGTRGIPSGHLYVALMAHITIDTYNTIIDALINTGKIKQSNYLLTAVKT